MSDWFRLFSFILVSATVLVSSAVDVHAAETQVQQASISLASYRALVVPMSNLGVRTWCFLRP
jgi:hypothetical protein